MSESDSSQYSEDEIDEKTHRKLLDNILGLSSKQRIKNASRTEPTLNVSEFDLVKTSNNVGVNELADVFKGRLNQIAVRKKVQGVERKAATLKKPLEKVQADRIRRSVSYQNTKNVLDRWEPIVTSLRATGQIKFPLQTDVNLIKERKSPLSSKWTVKSDLEKKLEELEPQTEVYEIDLDTEEKFPLTMTEMMEKRKEAAKLRAQQSYKEAKARRQNKIKSKKFHRIQKREKVKAQMKEFELLQKTDPEAALKKLEEIEMARAEERASLRHKSTGKWARSKQIRAKYDKDSRQVLAQQLGISRDLTQKTKPQNDSSDEEDEPAAASTLSVDNPWVNDPNIKVSSEVDAFVSGYRKYWEEQNIKKKNGENDNIEVAGNDQESVQENEDKNSDSDSESKIKNQKQKLKKRKVIKDDKDEPILNGKNAKEVENNSTSKPQIKKVKSKKIQLLEKKVKKAKTLLAKQKELQDDKLNLSNQSTSDWDITTVGVDLAIQKQIEKKLKKLKHLLKISTSHKDPKEKDTIEEKRHVDLSLQKKKLRPEINDGLIETRQRRGDSPENIEMLKTILESKPEVAQTKKDIDPNKYMQVKPVQLHTTIPDLYSLDDNEASDQRGVISEAFEDDDIADNFQKEKDDDIDKNKPQSVDLSLPGWGAWGGTNLKISTRKRRRFITKFPQKMPRRDDNKGALIISEKANEAAKSHLVSELPFPFKTVKDFEASIRAPIGTTFVPETAFMKLVEPQIVTKMGTVITAMTEDILLKKKKK